MADDHSKKVALIEIDIDNKAAQEEMKKLSLLIIEQSDAVKDNNTAISSLNKANKDLEAQAKAGTITQKQAGEEIVNNNKKILDLKTANLSLKDGIKDLNKDRNSSIKASKLEADSLDALRHKVAAQKKELNGLNTSTAEGKKRFHELSDSIKLNNQAITRADQGAGDFRSSIGQYNEEVKKALDSSGAMSQSMGAISGIVPSVGKGISTLGGTLKGVFAIMKANPIIFLAGLLMQLFNLFKKSQAGMDALRVAGAVLNGVIGVFVDIIENTIDTMQSFMKKALKDPVQLLKDFKDALVDNFIKYFTETIPEAIKQVLGAFATLWEAIITLDFGKAAEAVGQYADGISNLVPGMKQAKEGIVSMGKGLSDLEKKTREVANNLARLEKMTIMYERALADNEVEISKTLVQQANLKNIYEDQSQSYEDRIDATQKLAKIEHDQLNKTLAIQKLALAGMLVINQQTNSTEEDLQKVRDKKIEINKLEEQSVNLLTATNKREQAIKKKRDAEEAKAEKQKEADKKKREKEAADARKKREKEEDDARKKREKEEEDARKKREKEEEDARKAKEDRDKRVQDLEASNQERRQQLLIDSLKKEAGMEQARVEDMNNIYSQLNDLEAERHKESLEKSRKYYDDLIADEKTHESEKRALFEESKIKEQELAAAFEEKKDQLKEERDGRIAGIKAEKAAADKKADEDKVESTVKALDDISYYTQAAANVAVGIFDVQNNLIEQRYSKRYAKLENDLKNNLISEKTYAKKKEALDKGIAREKHKIAVKAFYLEKASEAASIIINTARAITQTLPNIPLSIAMGALGGIQLAKVLTTPAPPPPSFAEGGGVRSVLDQGRPHSGGGSIWHNDLGQSIEVEGGEALFVTKKEASNPALHLLDSVNRAYGGASMFGPPQAYMENGGQTAPIGLRPEDVEAIAGAILKQANISVNVETIMGGISAVKDAEQAGVV